MVKNRKQRVTRIVVQEENIEQHRYCDHCSKEILEDYFSITTHCDDWGEDSYDSYQYKDICSKKCLKSFFDDWINNLPDNNNTETIEISHINKAF